MVTFLLLGLLAHTIADFLLQTDTIVETKNSLSPKGFLVHGSRVAIISAIGLHIYGVRGLIAALMITVTHVFIDLGKCYLDRNAGSSQRLLVFVVDQVLHLLSFLAVFEIVEPSFSQSVLNFYGRWLFPKARSVMSSLLAKTGLSLDRFLLVALGYVIVMPVGAVIVRMVLDAFNKELDRDSSTQAGRYIGMAERALMLTLVLADALTAVAFVITAKSLARFEKLTTDKAFGEYYLVGTLASTLLAIAVGLTIRGLVRVI